MGRSSLHPFFKEGLAELYGGQQTRFGFSAPSTNEDTDRYTNDIRTATHFLRWLREHWGPHPLARLAHEEKDGFSDFESIYGMTIEEAEQLYFMQAPYAYASLYDCQDPELASAEMVDGWIDTISLDCEAGVDTRRAGEGIIVHRTIEVPEPGYYSVSTDGEWFEITGDLTAACWCSGEGTPCDPTSPAICVDETSLATCEDGEWVFDDCAEICGTPSQCVPWQTPATCVC